MNKVSIDYTNSRSPKGINKLVGGTLPQGTQERGLGDCNACPTILENKNE